MKLHIIAIGTKMPQWVQDGYAEYEKRLPKEWKPKLLEFGVAKRAKNTSVARLKELEADQILDSISPSAHVIALEVLGKQADTLQLSKSMQRWQELAKPTYIIIGGPDGLAERCLARADEKLSLSRLTLPHPLVRVLLIEQLYRGWTLIQQHPYHK